MLLAATAFAGTPAMAQQGTESRGATANTERANAAVRQAMTMNDNQDFEDATRGLMAQLKDPIVKAADGRVVWNTQRYEFVKGDPPVTVNPSLGASRSSTPRPGCSRSSTASTRSAATTWPT
jgi:Alkyl sulfatase and related hydrolases